MYTGREQAHVTGTLLYFMRHAEGCRARRRRLIEGTLKDEEVNSLAVVAMGGAAAEAMHYPEVAPSTPTAP